MNSFTGSKSQRPPSSSSSSSTPSFDSYRFDFGTASDISASSRPLNAQKLSPNIAASKPPAPINNPSWIHRPSSAVRSGLPNPSPSMAGDIFGRNWSSAVSSSATIGIQDKNPNLFSDLLGSAIGQSKSSSFSMADLKKSIPQTNNPNPNPNPNSTKANPDPFSSLMGFASKSSASFQTSKRSDFGMPQQSNVSSDFQNSKRSDFGKTQQSNGSSDYSFGDFKNSKRSDFGKTQPADVGSEHLNMFFSSPLASKTAETERTAEMRDWDVSSEFGGATTEIEGLPPPPTGVTASAAKTKGLDSYKQGQFADAIKWLSWSLVLLEKSGNVASCNEVLICRASCYKEVGEYKKAIADCSKVLNDDSSNVSVLVQRALLYESSEKYRLGAEDLRAVLKLDPANRLARSTIHRLNQFAD